ncbi:MAG: sulfatase, partial [Acidobacteriota bacterium]
MTKGESSSLKRKHFLKQLSVVLLCAFLFLFPVPSCHPLKIKPIEKIILITLDTTRADRLGCYGYKSIKTPNLDRIAAEGFLFENATCQVPMTLPSHATIMTGLYPPRHGVRNNTNFALGENAQTLAELLKQNGFKTGAAISSFMVHSKFGMAQGFDEFDQKFYIMPFGEPEDWAERRAQETIDATIEWFGRNHNEEKFFYWLHLYDPHQKYDPPYPYADQYVNNPYDGEIAYMDAELGRFFEYLKRIKLYDKTLFLIIGDHGEAFGEHGEYEHQNLIYESTMRIPFIIKMPGANKPKRIEVPVSTVDMFSTVLDLANMKIEGNPDGSSLVPLMKWGGSKWTGIYYIETMAPNLIYGWSSLKGIRSLEWKFIESSRSELYNLSDDPGENENRIDKNP